MAGLDLRQCRRLDIGYAATSRLSSLEMQDALGVEVCYGYRVRVAVIGYTGIYATGIGCGLV